MPRPSKLQVKQRAEIQVRAEKAKQSILSKFGELIGKHIEGLIVQPGSDASAQATIRLTLTPDGTAALAMTYQKTITDASSFALDDGQSDLPLNRPTPPPSGTKATGGEGEAGD